MSKPFDATLNSLIDDHVSDWGRFLASRTAVPIGPVTILDTDLSSTLQADRLFRIDGACPAAIHLELESTGRLGIPEELLRYNVAAWGAAGMPVHSILVLLRPKANASDQTGLLQLPGADSTPYLTFRYTVVRVWRESIEGLLAAGPGIAPLALLTNEAAANLPAAFDRFRERLQAEPMPANVERALLGSTFVLCGLRYSTSQIENLYRDLSMTLEDSTTYQLILNRGVKQGVQQGVAQGIQQGVAQGASAEAQRLLLLLGVNRFGAASTDTERAIQAITDRDRLERMVLRILQATTWDDLLGTS